MKKYMLIVITISVFIGNWLVIEAQGEEELREYYEKTPDGEIWVWNITDWEGAKKVAEDPFPYPITPKYKIGPKEGEFLIYAHRKLACPFCGYTYVIGFAGPFSRTICKKCGKEFDEKIALYKWKKIVEKNKLLNREAQ